MVLQLVYLLNRIDGRVKRWVDSYVESEMVWTGWRRLTGCWTGSGVGVRDGMGLDKALCMVPTVSSHSIRGMVSILHPVRYAVPPPPT